MSASPPSRCYRAGRRRSRKAWDKTFPKSERVDHRKVSCQNRLGITLVADLYVPNQIDPSRRHAALVVGGPYGAVKEQASGLYAQTMAERGFIAIAHDPSYVGESGGQPQPTSTKTLSAAKRRRWSPPATRRSPSAATFSDDAAVASMVDRAVAEFGRLDAAFNNAGVMARIVRVADSSRDEWDRVIGINLRGVWSGMR